MILHPKSSRRCLVAGFMLVFLLAFTMLISSSPPASAYSGSGSGTPGDPYIITNVDQLQEMKDNLSAHYALGNDIDASATIGWDNGAGFLPVGTPYAAFTGSLDGQGYKITNLYINRPTTDFVGLFGCSQGVVKNVGLENVNVTGRVHTGGLVGFSGYWATPAKVDNCYSTGSVSGDDRVGGLVGSNQGPGKIYNSYSTGSVTGDWHVGGLVGHNYHSGGTVDNCYSTGSVSGSGEQVGGLVGRNEATVKNCYSRGSAHADGWWAGGLVGFNFTTGIVSNSYSTGVPSVGGSGVGGLVGGNQGTVSNSFWDTETSGRSTSDGGTGKATENMKNVRTFTDTSWSTGLTTPWDFVGNPYDDVGDEDIWNMDASENINDGYPFLVAIEGIEEPLYTLLMEGSGTLEDPWIITNVNQLQAMKDNLTAYYALGNDIDASATKNWNENAENTEQKFGFVPVGRSAARFSGSLDGRGYVIENLYINRPGTSYVGLFGWVSSSGWVKNVGLIGVDIVARRHVGGLAGLMQGAVENCYSTGSVSGTDPAAGGLVGYNRPGGIIKDSYSTANVSSHGEVGGLVGWNRRGWILDSYAMGDATGIGWYVGGFVGHNEGTITRSYATGAASAEAFVGGFAGYNEGTITRSYATGSATGVETGGEYEGSRIGGFVGLNEKTGLITDSYSRGASKGVDPVGGFVGANAAWENEHGTIINSYSTGLVTGTGGYVGGFVGWYCGTISNSFWDNENSSQSTSDGGTGKTTAEMKNVRTYTDNTWSEGLDTPWDFVGNPYYDVENGDIWDNDGETNDGYPFLTSFVTTKLVPLNQSPFEVAPGENFKLGAFLTDWDAPAVGIENMPIRWENVFGENYENYTLYKGHPRPPEADADAQVWGIAWCEVQAPEEVGEWSVTVYFDGEGIYSSSENTFTIRVTVVESAEATESVVDRSVSSLWSEPSVQDLLQGRALPKENTRIGVTVKLVGPWENVTAEDVSIWVRDMTDNEHELQVDENENIGESLRFWATYDPADNLLDNALGYFDVRVVVEGAGESDNRLFERVFQVGDLDAVGSHDNYVQAFENQSLRGMAVGVGRWELLEFACVLDNLKENALQVWTENVFYENNYEITPDDIFARLPPGGDGEVTILLLSDNLEGSWTGSYHAVPFVLDNEGVDPGQGVLEENPPFTYTVTAIIPKNSVLEDVFVYINGEPYKMENGAPENGPWPETDNVVYSYTWYPYQEVGNKENIGDHTYYFTATDGTDNFRYPSSGAFSDPSISSEDFWSQYAGFFLENVDIYDNYYFNSSGISPEVYRVNFKMTDTENTLNTENKDGENIGDNVWRAEFNMGKFGTNPELVVRWYDENNNLRGSFSFHPMVIQTPDWLENMIEGVDVVYHTNETDENYWEITVEYPLPSGLISAAKTLSDLGIWGSIGDGDYSLDIEDLNIGFTLRSTQYDEWVDVAQVGFSAKVEVSGWEFTAGIDLGGGFWVLPGGEERISDIGLRVRLSGEMSADIWLGTYPAGPIPISIYATPSVFADLEIILGPPDSPVEVKSVSGSIGGGLGIRGGVDVLIAEGGVYGEVSVRVYFVIVEQFEVEKIGLRGEFGVYVRFIFWTWRQALWADEWWF